VTRPAGPANPPSARPADVPATRAIKVLLADDQVLVRSGFKLLLDTEDDITVVGEAANGAEAVALARATRPDVVLMDIRMPVLDGIQATREIAAMRGLEQVRVLILTTYDTDAYVFEAAGRGQRLPAQRQRPGRAAARHPRGRGRGGAAGAEDHPPPDRAVHRGPHRRTSGRGPTGRADPA
jgi:CheY-like chemotaxis protein